MHIDVLVAEIGSTTTVVNAFKGIHTEKPQFIGQGQAPTTVLEGDVTTGLKGAITHLRENLNVEELTWDDMLATSSAAGGLKMTVHGLVYDMTVRAAREAALGAGGVLRKVTAGELTEIDMEEIEEIKPNIILLAGGVDYGEKNTVISNAKKLALLQINAPFIFAGNIAARGEVKKILEEAGKKVTFVDNVYPRIDELNIEPTRRLIQRVFEEHIIHAPGMNKIREMVKGPIIPTPGAVMNAAKRLQKAIGDLIVFDVGGATTDLHSVTEGSEAINKILINPEPFAKRTVEGDLGVFVNAKNIFEAIGEEAINEELGIDAKAYLENLQPIPVSDLEKRFVERLTLEAVMQAVKRHVGRIKYLYGPTGRITVAEGKDLTVVKWIIGTGGALTRLPGRIEILEKVKKPKHSLDLLPGEDAQILIDNDYIMASLGVLGEKYPLAALWLQLRSLALNPNEYLTGSDEKNDES